MENNIEPELLSRTPRELALRNNARSQSNGCLAIFLIPFVAIGTFTFIFALCLTSVMIFGKTTTGFVTDKRELAGKKSHSYSIKYCFNVDGKRYNGSDSVKLDDFNDIGIESPVQVKYLPSAPLMFPTVITAHDSRIGAVLFIWAHTTIWNLLIWFIIYQIFWRPRIIRTVYLNGEPALAEITNKKRISGKTISYFIEYQFKPQETVDIIAKGSVYVSPEDGNKIEVGDCFTVLYLPNKPNRSVLYQFGPYSLKA